MELCYPEVYIYPKVYTNSFVSVRFLGSADTKQSKEPSKSNNIKLNTFILWIPGELCNEIGLKWREKKKGQEAILEHRIFAVKLHLCKHAHVVANKYENSNLIKTMVHLGKSRC